MPQKGSHAVDLGLAVLSAVNRGGVALSQNAIATIIGCDKRTIQKIEQRALKKVRLRLTEFLHAENLHLR